MCFKKKTGSALVVSCLLSSASAFLPLHNIAMAAEYSSEVRAYNISAGPLSTVLTQFATESGLTLSADAQLTDGKHSPGLKGSFTQQQALDRLLSGSGLISEQKEGVVSLKLIPSSQAEDLGTISVIGELQSRSLLDTVTSVQVVQARASENKLHDVLMHTANVDFGGFDDRMSIRGIGLDGVGFAGDAQTISIDIDGVPVDNWAVRTGWNSLWDMEQVEILRGSQSTSQGRNALAGAIVFRSKRPDFESEGQARLMGGNDGTYTAAIAHGGQLKENALAFRLSAETDQSDGYLFNPTYNDDKYGHYDRKTFRGSLLWHPNKREDLTVLATLRHSDSEHGENDVNNDDNPFDYQNASGYPNAVSNAVETTGLAVEVDWHINDDLGLVSTTTLSETDYYTRTGFDLNPSNTNERSRDAEVKGFTQDLKFDYSSNQWDGVFGLYTSHFDEEEQFGGSLLVDLLVPGGDATAFGYDPGAMLTINAKAPNKETNVAVYTEWDYLLNDKWTLTGGLRTEYEKRRRTDDSDQSVSSLADPIGLSGNNDELSSKHDAFVVLPKIGARYAVSETTTLGAQIQRGYRSGGTDFDLSSGSTNDYDPEYTWTGELSLRSRHLDNRIRINANVFYTRWEDMQVPVAVGETALTITKNAGKSHLYGGEIEINGFLDSHRQWDAFVSLGLLETRIDEYKSDSSVEGNEFPLAANITASTGITYTHPAGFFGGLDASYVGERSSDINETKSLIADAYTVVNARAGYQTQDWKLTAFANNLLDEKIQISRATDLALATGTPLQVGFVLETQW